MVKALRCYPSVSRLEHRLGEIDSDDLSSGMPPGDRQGEFPWPGADLQYGHVLLDRECVWQSGQIVRDLPIEGSKDSRRDGRVETCAARGEDTGALVDGAKQAADMTSADNHQGADDHQHCDRSPVSPHRHGIPKPLFQPSDETIEALARMLRWNGGEGVPTLTRNPHLEDVLGPLAATIVRELAGRAEASVADVVDALSRRQRRRHAYTTIMTVMGRLHEKGVLERERRGRQYIYRVAASEAELVDRLSGVAVDRLVDRYGTAALRHFAVRLADLDPATSEKLVALAEDEE